MELKVWVDGVFRVVCGISPTTSCQDVVVALAQAIGRTGRYALILRLRGTERPLAADDCPLQLAARLEGQFVLRWSGSQQGGLPPPPAAEPLRRREPRKALTFSLGPSAPPRRTKPSGASPEPPAASKDEALRQILQQQRRLRGLQLQLEALQRQTEALWELERLPAPAAGGLQELEELEERLRLNEAELLDEELWEQQAREEEDREREMHRRLQQIHSSVDDRRSRIEELQARAERLELDLQLRAAGGRSAWLPDEALRPLKQELHARLQQAGELDSTLSQTQRELQAAEERLQDRWEQTAALSQELRHWKLQQFVQQPNAEPDVYLSSAGIKD